MRFALQCYVDRELYEAVKLAADAAHMSVSQWLKLAVIGTIEGQDEAAFRALKVVMSCSPFKRKPAKSGDGEQLGRACFRLETNNFAKDDLGRWGRRSPSSGAAILD